MSRKGYKQGAARRSRQQSPRLRSVQSRIVVDVKALCHCRVSVDGVTPLRLVMNEQAVEHALHHGYRVIDTTIRGWAGFNALIEVPTSRVEHGWASYLARFEDHGISVARHPEAVIGRPLEEAEHDELLDWGTVSAVTDEQGLIRAVEIRGFRARRSPCPERP